MRLLIYYKLNNNIKKAIASNTNVIENCTSQCATCHFASNTPIV